MEERNQTGSNKEYTERAADDVKNESTLIERAIRKVEVVDDIMGVEERIVLADVFKMMAQRKNHVAAH